MYFTPPQEYYKSNFKKTIVNMVAWPYLPYQILLLFNELLLFFKDPIDDLLQLCISNALYEDIFILVHD